ncbi:hypothetical protein L1987_80745 [Smallanthus sonchifolius]|uniref:Uncharacterized protein n=1 Tax=Smallanthus sonchifolius TaxID=185202 RepID=A0ACB8YST3_9ASTR|nr:hypothetical protein L1987_80745 [Smallanthus sonchifolius]
MLASGGDHDCCQPELWKLAASGDNLGGMRRELGKPATVVALVLWRALVTAGKAGSVEKEESDGNAAKPGR